MSNSRSPAADGPLLRTISVNVALCNGSHCNAGEYNVTYDGKPNFEIDKHNTIIRFELDQATSQNVLFVGMTTDLSRADPQLSNYAISIDRRVLICIDLDSKLGPVNVTLQWIVGTPVSHDPQLHNKPG
jgi:hypothetical protein